MIIPALLTKNDTEQKFSWEHGQQSQKNFHQRQVYVQLPQRDRECSKIQLHKLMFHQKLLHMMTSNAGVENFVLTHV